MQAPFFPVLGFASLAHILLIALSAYLYTDSYRIAPGVHAHGLIGIAGFCYCMFLSFLITRQRYGNRTMPLQILFALFSLIMATGALLSEFFLLNLAASASLFGCLMLWHFFRNTSNQRENVFLRAAVIISVLCWVYFLYSLNFEYFFIFETRFSYVLLALSFPMSLLLFSRYVDMLNISTPLVNLTIATLVGGVLSMFFGMLLQWYWVEKISAGVLLLLISLYLIRAFRLGNIALIVAFTGLLLTGLSGVWYVLVAESGTVAMDVLRTHAHLAHFAWATFGIYLLLMLRHSFSSMQQALFLSLLLLSLTALVPHLLFDVPILLHISTTLFLAAGLCLPLALWHQIRHNLGIAD